MKTIAKVSALAAVFAGLAIGCGGGGSGQVSFSGALLENYLAVADDGTAYLVEYEVSQVLALVHPPHVAQVHSLLVLV